MKLASRFSFSIQFSRAVIRDGTAERAATSTLFAKSRFCCAATNAASSVALPGTAGLFVLLVMMSCPFTSLSASGSPLTLIAIVDMSSIFFRSFPDPAIPE